MRVAGAHVAQRHGRARPGFRAVKSNFSSMALTKRVLEQLTNIQHPLSGGLDKRWSGYVSVCDPTNNNQAQQDRHHTYRRCVITLFPNHSRALQGEEHPTISPAAARKEDRSPEPRNDLPAGLLHRRHRI
jgi:hypothetical protein